MKSKKILKIWRNKEKGLASMNGHISLYPAHAHVKGWFSSSDLYQMAKAQKAIEKLFNNIEEE